MKEYRDGWTIKLITRPGIRERLDPPTSIEELLAPPGTVCSSLQNGLADRSDAIECLRLTVENELEALNYLESRSSENSEAVVEVRKRHRAYLIAAKSLVEQEIASAQA